MTLKPTSPLLVLVATVVVLSAASAASASAPFNITRLLGHFPEFGAFNDLLTRTKLSEIINHRQTITVLALNNHTISTSLAGKPLDVIKDILSVHVVLDFFGLPKLRYIVKDHRSGSVFATLFQATGKAKDRQGFVNVSVFDDGQNIAFGSAVEGSPLVAKVVGSVAVRPYNISVLHVSSPIVPQGVDPNPSPPSPPAPAEEDDYPAEAPGPVSDDEGADGPVDDSLGADALEADVKAPSDAPVSYSPEPDVPDAGVAVEIPESEKSGSGSALVGSVVGAGVIIGLLSFF